MGEQIAFLLGFLFLVVMTPVKSEKYAKIAGTFIAAVVVASVLSVLFV